MIISINKGKKNFSNSYHLVIPNTALFEYVYIYVRYFGPLHVSLNFVHYVDAGEEISFPNDCTRTDHTQEVETSPSSDEGKHLKKK